jgi:hypothetical protein
VDTCQNGLCVGASPVVCGALDQVIVIQGREMCFRCSLIVRFLSVTWLVYATLLLAYARTPTPSMERHALMEMLAHKQTPAVPECVSVLTQSFARPLMLVTSLVLVIREPEFATTPPLLT